jgi:hypothetical protein
MACLLRIRLDAAAADDRMHALPFRFRCPVSRAAGRRPMAMEAP